MRSLVNELFSLFVSLGLSHPSFSCMQFGVPTLIDYSKLENGKSNE